MHLLLTYPTSVPGTRRLPEREAQARRRGALGFRGRAWGPTTSYLRPSAECVGYHDKPKCAEVCPIRLLYSRSAPPGDEGRASRSKKERLPRGGVNQTCSPGLLRAPGSHEPGASFRPSLPFLPLGVGSGGEVQLRSGSTSSVPQTSSSSAMNSMAHSSVRISRGGT